MNIEQILAALLNPNGSQAAPQMAPMVTPVGDHAGTVQQRLGGMPMQSPQMQPQQQAMPQQAPQGQPMPQNAPQPAPAANGGGLGGLGGILQNIIAPQSAQKNQTVGWLTKQGLDQGTATVLASDKTALRQYIMARSQGQKPIEIAGRLVDPVTFKVLADFSDKGDKLQSVGKDSSLYDPSTGKWITPPKPDNGGAFRFEGTSVDAQALNGLMDSGALTPEQAQQVAAGKTVTNPADGSIMFLTPQGIFSQSSAGGPAQPIAGGGAPTAPAPAGGLGAPAAPAGPGARPGMIPLTDGKPGKLATEAETKNRALYTVIKPEADIVEKNFDALSNLADQAGGMLPGSNYITSPEYQRASNSLKTIVASYLYSVSGATANPGEVKNQVDILTPKVGESKASIADKRARIKTMVDAVRQAGGNWTPPQGPQGQSAPDSAPTKPPATYEGDPKLWQYMTPEQRKLWQ